VFCRFRGVYGLPVASETSSGGAREAAREVLGRRLTEEQVNTLFDEVLTLSKRVWLSCPSCKKKSQVDIPDAKAVVGALADIVTKIADLPSVQESGERIVFQRLVEMPEEDVDA